MLDLDTIRERNALQPEGYWKTTAAALCDEVERLKPRPLPGIDAIRRMGDHIPPWIVRQLCDRVERAERDAARWKAQASAWAENIAALTEERDGLRTAVFAWADAIERCDGIAAAEEALREVVKELRS